jgi:hypothetical protein
MSKNSEGTPPYQLSCGHRPSSQYAARHVDDDEDDRPVRYVKKASPVKHHFVANSRAVETKPITKIRIAGKTKTIVKLEPKQQAHAKASKQSHHASAISSKASSKTKVAAASSSKSSTKSAQPVTKSKTSAKPEKVVHVATSNSHGKGFFVPTSKTKAATSTASETKKGKGYYKPESSSKTVAKATTKSKHSSKNKS